MLVPRTLALLWLAGIGACSGESQEDQRQMNQDQAHVSDKEHVVGGKTAEDVFGPGLAKLARAACTGDVPGVEAAIRAGADPNGVGFEGTTPLIWALNCENLSGMEALLKAGADPNVRFGNTTPICLAAQMENSEPLKLLLKHGGDADAYNQKSPWSALSLAFSLGMKKKDWTNYYALIDAGANVNRVHNADTIAQFAADMQQYDKVAELLDRGYSTGLDYLGLITQRELVGSPELMRPQEEWRDRVLEMLKARGVQFPVPQSAALQRPGLNDPPE
jgi:ankyrin repeat protein